MPEAMDIRCMYFTHDIEPFDFISVFVRPLPVSVHGLVALWRFNISSVRCVSPFVDQTVRAISVFVTLSPLFSSSVC